MFSGLNSHDLHMGRGMFDYRIFKKAMEETKEEALNNWTPKGCRFDPYSFEGGTSAAIAGKDFVVIGGDMRMSTNGAVVQSRHLEKVFKLEGGVVLASSGFYGDLLQLVRVLRARMKVYQFTYNEKMSIHAAAEMLARTLYYKRFFPYYTSNTLAGIDPEGNGAVYRYDPVGTIERVNCDIHGAGEAFMQLFLDSQVVWMNKSESTRPPLTIDRAKKILRDGFRAVAERETSTGDKLHLIILAAGKPLEEEVVDLRAD